MTRALAPVLVFCSVCVTPSWAQKPAQEKAVRPPGSVKYASSSFTFMNSIALLRLPEVCQELKIEGDQLTRIDQELAVIVRGLDTAIREIPGTGSDEEQKRVAKISDDARRDGEQRIAKILRPAQIDRYHQIGFQRRGGAVFDDPEVQKSLSLTDDQKSRIGTIAKEQRDKLRALEFFDSDTIQKNDAERVERSVAAFTPAQRETWNKLHGAPFAIAPGTALRERKLPPG
jgi:hypothetical protein